MYQIITVVYLKLRQCYMAIVSQAAKMLFIQYKYDYVSFPIKTLSGFPWLIG